MIPPALRAQREWCSDRMRDLLMRAYRELRNWTPEEHASYLRKAAIVAQINALEREEAKKQRLARQEAESKARRAQLRELAAAMAAEVALARADRRRLSHQSGKPPRTVASLGRDTAGGDAYHRYIEEIDLQSILAAVADDYHTRRCFLP